MKFYRTFMVSYQAPTEHQGARVRIKDLSEGTRIFIPFNYELNTITEMAKAHLKSIGIPIVAEALTHKSGWDSYLLLSNEYVNLLEK